MSMIAGEARARTVADLIIVSTKSRDIIVKSVVVQAFAITVGLKMIVKIVVEWVFASIIEDEVGVQVKTAEEEAFASTTGEEIAAASAKFILNNGARVVSKR